MLARMWRGWTSNADTETYISYLHRTGLKAYRATPGNQAAYILHRPDGERTEFVTLTFWDSLDSVRMFAGDQYEQAVFYPEDDQYLVARETTSTHYEVVEARS